MKDNNNNANHANVIPNLFRNLKNTKMLKQVQHDATGSLALGGRGLGRGGNPLQNDATTCAPLEGEPKSLISKGGKNALGCNQEPSPEFVSSSQLTNKFYPLTGREGKKNGKELINLSTYRLIDFKKKIAFTLAETLIALGIIGVVAALTIPGLITKYHRHVVETKLVKFDSIINQAVRMSIAENDDLVFTPPTDGVDKAKYLKEWFDENLMKYIKADYDGGLVGGKYYKLIFHDGTGFVAYIPSNGSNIYFFYCLEAKDKSCRLESFDGKNTFLFTYEPSQKAVLPGSFNVTDVNKLKYGFGQDKGGTGGCYQTTRTDRHTCSQLIKQNGWKIPDDYPWIK